jgi:phosphomevalonate kinase
VTAVAARAPGKLVLLGEYAVLCGGPALVAAVDRHAEVRLALAPAAGPLTVRSEAEEERWTVPGPDAAEPTGGDLGAVIAAFRVAAAWEPALAGRGADVHVDTRAFFAGRDGGVGSSRKLGLGRSAASITAAVAAFLAAAGRDDRAVTCEAAVAAHALFQEGRGSGADVAAAAHGGVVEFRRDGGRLRVDPRALPPGLRLVVGWTGEPAPTDPLVKRFVAYAARHEAGVVGDLCATAERGVAAVVAGDAASFCDAVARTAELLARLGADAGIPIVTPALARLVEIARAAGVAAKPSGAGGGDCGIAFARSGAEADALRAAWRDAGIVPLPVGIAPDGVASAPDPEGDEVSLA